MNKKINLHFFQLITVLMLSLLTNTAFAQKSSGVIKGEIKNLEPASSVQNTSAVKETEEVNDEVTLSVSASRNNVRFLLRPKQEAVISSQMVGVISDIKFAVGQRFKKGDTLISLKCGVQNAQVQAQRARVKEYSLTHQSNKDLLAGSAVSKYEVDITRSQLNQQSALLKEAVIVASLCNVKAPFTGGVVSVDVNEFEIVSLGTPLLKIIDDNSLVMSLNIPSFWINKVSVGNFFTINVDETNGNYRAKVTGVSPAIDPVSKTIELRAVLAQKAPELRPGMSGSTSLDFSEK